MCHFPYRIKKFLRLEPEFMRRRNTGNEADAQKQDYFFHVCNVNISQQKTKRATRIAWLFYKTIVTIKFTRASLLF